MSLERKLLGFAITPSSVWFRLPRREHFGTDARKDLSFPKA
jgi:hypothetical protein